MARSSTALIDPAEEAPTSAHLLGSSFGSLSSPRKVKSEILNTYREASELFVTRRLPEALLTIKPLITVAQPSEDIIHDEGASRNAPIASASRKHRIKVWVFYLTLLNAIAELDPGEAKTAFGSKEWKELVTKAQDGSIWDEVISIGYQGIVGDVDADVVASLATLLLAQSESQRSNQRHLESYLSVSSSPTPDKGTRLDHSEASGGDIIANWHRYNGPDTPQDLIAYIKIIELYTLHVLPRNGELGYAKEFISMSEVLDEDLREAFLQDLQSLEDEELKGEESFEAAVLLQEVSPEHDLERHQGLGKLSIGTAQEVSPSSHHRSNSETDYGIEQTPSSLKGLVTRPPPPQPPTKNAKLPKRNVTQEPSAKAARKSSKTNSYKRSLTIMTTMQNLVLKIVEQLSRNPLGFLRFVLFLMGLVVALSRPDIKNRLERMTGNGWDKIRRTIGMGVKVSYI